MNLQLVGRTLGVSFAAMLATAYAVEDKCKTRNVKEEHRQAQAELGIVVAGVFAALGYALSFRASTMLIGFVAIPAAYVENCDNKVLLACITTIGVVMLKMLGGDLPVR